MVGEDSVSQGVMHVSHVHTALNTKSDQQAWIEIYVVPI